MLKGYPRAVGRTLYPLALVLLTACGGVSFNIPAARHEQDQPSAASPKEIASHPPARVRQKDDEKTIQEALEGAQKSAATYRINPADLMEITVYQEKDLDRKARVSPEGTITLPLAGSVKVGGLTVADAERAIVSALKKFIVDPQVSILIQEYGNKIIYVLGEVAKPGTYTLPTEATFSVLEVVIMAGGFTQYADKDHTRVIRRTGGEKRTIVVNVSAIMKKGDKSQDIPLEPNDVVYIPESFF